MYNRHDDNKKNKGVKLQVLSSILALGMSLFLLTGCGMDALDRKIVFTTGFSNNEVFRIEDSSCSLTEMKYYLVSTQRGYEDNFGSQIWDQETDSGTVEERLKDSVLAKVAQIKVMNLLAKEKGIELDENEINESASKAAEYFDALSDEDKVAMNNLTLEDITQIYEERAVADKLYDFIIKDINPEISDDEARTITVEQILIKTYKTDASGDRVEYSAGEKDEAHRRIREIYKKLLNEESTFEELMGEYNEADESTVSFGKGELESAYEDAAFDLGTDQVSSIVETSDGYVLIKCISTFNREETEANKIDIVEDRKREVFGAQYDAFVTTLTKELNEKLWNSIDLMEN